MTGMLGTKDPEQVSIMAKQAGEVMCTCESIVNWPVKLRVLVSEYGLLNLCCNLYGYGFFSLVFSSPNKRFVQILTLIHPLTLFPDTHTQTQFISIVVNLLDALKTSFSHRSLAARSIGKKDSVSDAAIAGISMMKSYVRTYRTSDDKCMQRYLCEANNECSKDIGGSSIFCQLGT